MSKFQFHISELSQICKCDMFNLKGQGLLSKELTFLKNELPPFTISFLLLCKNFTVYSHLRINQPLFQGSEFFFYLEPKSANCCFIVIFNFCQNFRAPQPIFIQIGFENWKHISITSQIKTNAIQYDAIKIRTVAKLIFCHIFSSKSFGIHISENHLDTSFALFFWSGMDLVPSG